MLPNLALHPDAPNSGAPVSFHVKRQVLIFGRRYAMLTWHDSLPVH
jgi:hypothetical protein